MTFRAWQCSAENMSSPCLWIMLVVAQGSWGVKKHGGAGGFYLRVGAGGPAVLNAGFK